MNQPISRHTLFFFYSLAMGCFFSGAVFAQGEEAQIRKNLKERMPQIQPIDEVRRTPMPGLFELRVDCSDIYYTDANGHFLLQGQLIDTRNQRNLTEERLQKITAIDFKTLPFKDAISWSKAMAKENWRFLKTLIAAIASGLSVISPNWTTSRCMFSSTPYLVKIL